MKPQEQARKALEGALGGKKTEFEKWDKEIKKREESDGGGGNSGKGGWFGWFNWFRDENFWPEAQTAGLTILAILALVSSNTARTLLRRSISFIFLSHNSS